MMKPAFLIIAFVFAFAGSVNAQHEHHQHQDSTMMQPDSHVHATDSSGSVMSHAFSLHLPMNYNGSGTGWLTETSPMYGYMKHGKKWMYMLHGNIFIRYTNQDVTEAGTRGDTKLDAPNWFMVMGQRKVGERGLFHFNTMFSLDPLFGGEGYPLLFQTGETYNGKPLVDRQHPHNLFSELSVAYSYAVTREFDAFVYVGFPGEPALGPVAFMHRPSSLNNPDSPLGHHWQDATHITFGVVTGGVRYRIFKADASLFTGREPGEARYGFDEPRFDSYSWRVTANPAPSLSLQVSRAFIREPEGLHPDENVNRTTASATHAIQFAGDNKFLTSALVWGYNDRGHDHQENSFTFESNLQLDRFAAYGRYEKIEKSADELQLSTLDSETLFDIQAATLGFSYTLFEIKKTRIAAGAQGTLYHASRELNDVYGKNPKSVEVYIRVSPTLMKMK